MTRNISHILIHIWYSTSVIIERKLTIRFLSGIFFQCHHPVFGEMDVKSGGKSYSTIEAAQNTRHTLPRVLHIIPYMLQSFAEYARNLISRKKRKIVRSIISFYLLSSCVQVSSWFFWCACFYGIKGRDHTRRSCGFVLSRLYTWEFFWCAI